MPLFTVYSGELYENENHELTECHGFEDPDCSAQWSWDDLPVKQSIDDHLEYLGQNMQCNNEVSTPNYNSFIQHINDALSYLVVQRPL